MDNKYTKDFLTDMVSKLTGGTAYDPNITSYQYLDSVLESYLTDEQAQSYVRHTADSNGITKGNLVLDGDALILKDVKVIKEHDTQ